MTCGMLVLGPGMEAVPPALEAWNFNHWTIREIPKVLCFFLKSLENSLILKVGYGNGSGLARGP